MPDINKIYSFNSYYDAIEFVAQEAEARHSEVMDKLHVIEAALKAIFSTQQAAKETALAIADSLEASPISEDEKDRVSLVAAGLRKLALANPGEANSDVRLALTKSDLCPEHGPASSDPRGSDVTHPPGDRA